MNIKYIIIFLFIFFGKSSFAQKTLLGKVINSSDSTGIAGVNVMVEGSEHSTTTDSYGIFKITLPDTLQTLTFSFVGMYTEYVKIFDQDIVNVTMRKISTGIEEMQNLRVVSASKTAEKMSFAAAILTVVTRRDIEKLRLNTLFQLLDRLTAIYTTGSYIFTDNVPSMRGNLQTHFNNNVLVLVDGRPMRESIYGGIDSPIFTAFPLSCIEQIEIIRGPGSVLYGSNAFTGVINIITSKITKNTSNISARLGSFGAKQIEANTELKFNKLKCMLGAQFYDDNGWDYTTTNEADAEGTFPSSIKYDKTNFGAVAKAEYKSLKFLGIYTASRYSAFGPVPTLPEDTIKPSRLLLDIGYNHSFSQKLDVSANLTYNRFYMELPLGLTGPVLKPGTYDYYLQSNDILLELTAFYHPNQKLNFTFGSVINNRNGNGYAILGSEKPWIVPKYSDVLYTVYGMVDYQINKNIKALTGLQINNSPEVDFDVVPRLGLIMNFLNNDLLGFKLLYAKAFRSQSAFELNCYMPGIVVGNSNLVPEKIATLDAQILFRPKGFDISFGYFNSHHTNQITRSFDVEINSLRYVNGEWINSSGFELEMKCFAINNLIINGSISTQTNKTKAGLENVSHVPQLMAKIYLSYEFRNGISLQAGNSYFSKPSDVSVVSPTRKILNPIPEAFNYLSAGFLMDIRKNFNIKKFPQTILSIQCENLLNEKIYTPEFMRRRMNSIPGRPGRMWVAGITVKI